MTRSSLYESIGLTPYRALFVHLLLVGLYPLRFGLFLPTEWGKSWIFGSSGDSSGTSISSLLQFLLLPDPCLILFGKDVAANCTDIEEQALRDFGSRFLSQHILAWVVVFSMHNTTTTTTTTTTPATKITAFHRILLVLSVSTLLSIGWLQTFFHPTPNKLQELDPHFCNSMLVFHGMAILVSAWTVVYHQHHDVDVHPTPSNMKWSIPANAIFCGAVFNLFLATASFQFLIQNNDESYYHHEKATPVIRICFTLAALQTAILAILLLRIRYFLTISQLRSVCLYRIIANVVLPLFWFPELSPSLPIDHRITIAVRVCSTITYLLGYLWAGTAEGFSSILSSEKEE